MTLPKELVGAVRRLDEYQLRRLAILIGGLLIGSDGPDPSSGRPPVRYRQASIRCGKDCTACPHGPYWYAHWRENGRARSQYIGRELPADIRRLLEHDAR